MDVAGLETGKDFKLYPDGGRAWDWNEHGTRHDPGIQPGDVAELVHDHGASVIVLSRGMQRRLLTAPDTLRALADAGVQDVRVEQTEDAVKTYNRLTEDGKRVAGLFHSTC